MSSTDSDTLGKVVGMPPESVVDMTRNEWTASIGIGGRHGPDYAGRLRMKDSTCRKTGGYDLEHAYTTDPVASKVFYFLLQMAHLIAPLTQKGTLVRHVFPDGVGSAKNIAFRLLEARRNLRVNAQRMRHLLEARRQVRFAPT